MTKRAGGARRKTRQKFRRRAQEKGKVSIRDYLQQFNVGEKVVLLANSSVHQGMYFRRFHAKTGIIQKKRGSCYEVKVLDGKKEKITIVHPVHLHKP